MAKNDNLRKAKEEKKDEFYTQLGDIENELKNYKKHFENKTVFCNCDDPEYSNFWKYFSLNFDHLKLKKLMATHFDKEKKSYFLEMYRDAAGVHTDIKTLEQNGDFRSPECVELLKEADIVCTNPPFSLFREYVAQLITYEKKFVIWGNNNAITYKEIFPLLKDNKMWLGYLVNQTCIFQVGKDYQYDKKITEKINDGNKYGKVPAISIFTNLDIKKRHEDLIMYKNYTPEEYPKYVNYDAINVNKVNEIPQDYFKNMGVPITFLNYYNPEQFEILGISLQDAKKISECVEPDAKYSKGGPAFYTKIKEKEYLRHYARLIIKRK